MRWKGGVGMHAKMCCTLIVCINKHVKMLYDSLMYNSLSQILEYAYFSTLYDVTSLHHI